MERLPTVVDHWHQEVCDTSSCIAPASNESVGRADHVLIKEPHRPDLTWNESPSEYANEESQRDETLPVID